MKQLTLADIVIGKRYVINDEGSKYNKMIGKCMIINEYGADIQFDDRKTFRYSVSSLQPVAPTCFEELRAGDVVKNVLGLERKVLFGNGLLIIVEDGIHTIRMLHKVGFEHNDYTIPTTPFEPKITELSMDDVAKLAGVPVEQLKIKKQ
jgi:hypothetical protein